MNSGNTSWSRRDFFKAASTAAALASVGALAGERLLADEDAKASPAASAGRPRIGCTSWCFHGFNAGADPTEAIEQIGRLGFEGIELILLGRDDIKDFWTEAKIAELRKGLDKYKLQVSQFVLFQPVVEGLTSTDPEIRKQNLDYFEAGCRIGRKFDAPMVNIVAPWARELRSPPNANSYLPRFYDLPQAKPGDKYHIDMAPSFDWDRLWQNFIDTIKACLDRAKNQGMKLTIEHHTHTMIHDATAFLRLWDAIRDPDLGYNLDVGWTLAQREYPPVAIHKTKGHLMNLHMRDIDGLVRKFVHVGEGIMDFEAVAAALRQVGFSGFMDLEQDKHPGNMVETCRRYVAIMKKCLGV